ncbi:hypothetical protein NL317_32155, partial [Klebsiella pneumoniae]|nr:hypothetical protein [Klebsiella pneumoniae]
GPGLAVLFRPSSMKSPDGKNCFDVNVASAVAVTSRGDQGFVTEQTSGHNIEVMGEVLSC